MSLQTEFEFTLPLGYVDREGTLHKTGTMRLATAMDEITPLNDMRVQSNDAYMVIILLARVITSLGTLRGVNTGTIENLFAADLAYLQEFYRQINETGQTIRPVSCPHCSQTLEVDLANLGGGIVGYPLERIYEEVAYVAYHFHWPLLDIMNLEHRQRQTWVREIAKINRRLNEGG